MSRSNLILKLQDAQSGRPKQYPKLSDEEVLGLIHEILRERPTYGYRRVTILLNSKLKSKGSECVNYKRVYRVMKQNKLLLEKPVKRPKRAHTGKVETLLSNTRWCSDCFSIQCENVTLPLSLVQS